MFFGQQSVSVSLMLPVWQWVPVGVIKGRQLPMGNCPNRNQFSNTISLLLAIDSVSTLCTTDSAFIIVYNINLPRAIYNSPKLIYLREISTVVLIFCYNIYLALCLFRTRNVIKRKQPHNLPTSLFCLENERKKNEKKNRELKSKCY